MRIKKPEKIVVPEDWKELLKKIRRRKPPNIIFVIGAVDTGKSVLSQFLFKQLSRRGFAALVDSDLGQSTIGPPTTVGLAVCKGPKSRFKPLGLRFVGSTSPRGHMLQTIVAVKKLVEKALELGTRNVVVDTSGFISGVIGHEFKFQKIDLVGPTHLVALEKEKELEALLRNLSQRKKVSLYRLKVHEELVRTRSFDERRLYRQRRFSSYFENAGLRHIYLQRVGLHGIVPDLTVKQKWKNLLIGLCDGENNTLWLGIIEDIDFSSGAISCITPLKKIDKVKTIQFGSVYLSKNGTEL